MNRYEINDYGLETDRICEFFQSYLDDECCLKYMVMLQEIVDTVRKVLTLDLNEMYSFDENLTEKFSTNASRFCEITYTAADKLMSTSNDTYNLLEKNKIHDNIDSSVEYENAFKMKALYPESKIPAELGRKYELRVIPLHKFAIKPKSLRNISAADIGKIVTTRVLVTHITNVQPLVTVCTYITNTNSGNVKTLFQVVKSINFKLYTEATGHFASKIGVSDRTPILLKIRGSKFTKFQEAKVQEISYQVPPRSIPRTITLRVRGELTHLLKPGDEAVVTGIFLPEHYFGYRPYKMGLAEHTYLDALNIWKEKDNYENEPCYLSESRRKDLLSLVSEIELRGESVYQYLSNSLAPEIYGHEDVKKAILLLMIGGVGYNLENGFKIRGNIHICLMGDPGVAKSQFLKYISNLIPRALYTNGRSSSSVGLTAAIAQDPVTGERSLQGGALVLADMGICCIDEFDKMDETERSSIHEVMEQQTVSIAKAGITTQLNARTSIVAAANPAYGSYDARRPPMANIDLPASLLSRFDLLWLIVDSTDIKSDSDLATHVVYVHSYRKPPNFDESTNKLNTKIISSQLTTREEKEISTQKYEPDIRSEKPLITFNSDLCRSFIALAKEYVPYVPERLTNWIATLYTEIRKEEVFDNISFSYTTVRTLISIIRLSQALAKTKLQNSVSTTDIEESIRLIRMSKISIYDH
eukprot:gnl/TRDRNA2_/TRDRNA2_175796_c0_seq1.p1 gnl/TRDRNA2_/TRDRNA2_175796_c0~~gnl/TRDRNA2_/TRDRNA2_175796_c0_seq1.p1  ORF type:complete len:699 (-),score=-36.62 gnl/TRDRNA2_/TRDRNA2_175796_c0_seq1:48-2144(-)